MIVPVAQFRRAVGRLSNSVGKYYARHRAVIHVSLLASVFFVVIIWQWVLVTIPAGHVGVMWYRLLGGTDTTTAYHEGTRFIFPWDQMPIYDLRLQNANSDFDVLTRDGMSMTVNVVIQFELNERGVPILHQKVGPDFVNTLLMPAIGADIRDIVSQNSMDDVYSSRRQQIQDEAKRRVADNLVTLEEALTGANRAAHPTAAPWLSIEAVLIRAMQFPPEVRDAVNRKMAQYEMREEYGYRLERERLESERKQVEAEGIARFQQIVGAGISENYLKWKGIDATLALAQSANAKVVVIGSGKNGMPLILGDSPANSDTPARPTGTPTEVPQTSLVPRPAAKASSPEITGYPAFATAPVSIPPQVPINSGNH